MVPSMGRVALMLLLSTTTDAIDVPIGRSTEPWKVFSSPPPVPLLQTLSSGVAAIAPFSLLLIYSNVHLVQRPCPTPTTARTLAGRRSVRHRMGYRTWWRGTHSVCVVGLLFIARKTSVPSSSPLPWPPHGHMLHSPSPEAPLCTPPLSNGTEGEFR